MNHKDYSIHVPPCNALSVRYYYNNEERLHPARLFPAHIHNDLEIYILLEGNVSFLVEKNLYTLSPGDAVITKPNELHNCVLNTTSTHKHICFWLRADEDNFLLKALLSTPFGQGHFRSAEKNRDEILGICQQLIENSDKDNFLLFYNVLTQILTFYSLRTPETILQSDTILPQQMNDILKYINKNFATIESVKELSQTFFISQSTLLRMFKTYVHTTPAAYLQTKKLAYSRVLLSRGESLVSASLQAGYPNVSNYIKLFKKQFGITPKQYVRQHE